jgi:hypothetical protein
VNEITQMRKQGVKKIDGVHVFNIIPEADSPDRRRSRSARRNPANVNNAANTMRVARSDMEWRAMAEPMTAPVRAAAP